MTSGNRNPSHDTGPAVKRIKRDQELIEQERELIRQERELIKREQELIKQEKELLKQEQEELVKQEQELIKQEQKLVKQEQHVTAKIPTPYAVLEDSRFKDRLSDITAKSSRGLRWAPPEFPVHIITIIGKCTTVVVLPSNTIDDLKAKIQARDGIWTDYQRLLLVGKQLEGGRTVEYYNMVNGTIIHLVLTMRGD